MASAAKRNLFDDELPPADDRVVKALSIRYRLTMGQVRCLIAKYGTEGATLEWAADRMRRC